MCRIKLIQQCEIGGNFSFKRILYYRKIIVDSNFRDNGEIKK